jgi:hypothetical protein
MNLPKRRPLSVIVLQAIRILAGADFAAPQHNRDIETS